MLTNEVPNNALGSADISVDYSGEVMAWIVDEDNNHKYELYIGSPGGILLPADSSSLFYNGLSFNNVRLIDVTNFDVSNVTDMSSMFYNTGISSQSYEIIGLETWDVSNVTNMESMFSSIG